jgi:beta-phosphoglucomutase
VLRAIVFDFDGVIANSEPLHYQAFRDVLAESRVALSEQDYYGRYLGFDDAGTFKAVAADRGLEWRAARISALVTAKARLMERLEADRSLLFPGAAAAIRRAADLAPLAIASGALGAEIRRILDREKLTPYFMAIVGAEDTPVSKPAPDPYLRALSLLVSVCGPIRPAESIAIEDSPWGLQSAKAAGLHTIAVAHTYAAAELDADAVISSLDQLDDVMMQRVCAV